MSDRMDPRTRALLEAPIASTLLRLAAPNVLVHGGAGGGRPRRNLFHRQARHRRARRGCAGIPRSDADADDVRRRDGRRHRLGHRAGPGRRPPRRGRCPGAARARDRARFWRRIHARRARRRPLALPRRWAAAVHRSQRRSTYSNWVFAGAVLVWLFNSLAAVIRGTGNMALPASVICVGALVLIPLSPSLIFGWGPFPALGIAGGALAFIAITALGSRVRRLSLVGQERAASIAARRGLSLATLSRHPARRRRWPRS